MMNRHGAIHLPTKQELDEAVEKERDRRKKAMENDLELYHKSKNAAERQQLYNSYELTKLEAVMRGRTRVYNKQLEVLEAKKVTEGLTSEEKEVEAQITRDMAKEKEDFEWQSLALGGQQSSHTLATSSQSIAKIFHPRSRLPHERHLARSLFRSTSM